MGVFLDVSTPRQQSQLRWGGGGGGGGTVHGEGERGNLGWKKAPSFCSIGVRTRDVPLYNYTSKRQNLLVLLFPAGAQRKILLDMIYDEVVEMGEEGVSTVYIL